MKKTLFILGVSLLALSGCSGEEAIKSVKEETKPVQEVKAETVKKDNAEDTASEIKTISVDDFKSYLTQVEKAKVKLPEYTVLDPKHTTVDAKVYKEDLTDKSAFIGKYISKPITATVFRQTHMSMDGENRQLDMLAYLTQLPLNYDSFEKVTLENGGVGYFKEDQNDKTQAFIFEDKGFTYVIQVTNAYGVYKADQYKEMAFSYN